jgi:hypothetical protein
MSSTRLESEAHVAVWERCGVRAITHRIAGSRFLTIAGSRFLTRFAVVVCISVLAIIAAECILNAIRIGTNCFDDAAYAVVSRNLAQGNGYLLSFDFDGKNNGGALFDPQLGSGPSIIMVGAVAVWIFGVHPAVPALGLILVNILIFAAWMYLLASNGGRMRALLYAAIFSISAVALTAKHHEQWFAFLGEFEAFLLAAVAFAAVSFGVQRARTFVLSGILLGLSFMAKELSALYILSFVVTLILCGALRLPETQCREGEAWRILRNGFLAVTGATAPRLFFELYRLYSLSAEDLVENWRHHFDYVYTQGLGGQPVGFDLIALRDAIMRDHYFLGLIPLAAITILASALIWRCCPDRGIRDYCLFLLIAFAIHLAYWVLISTGRPRYAFNVILFACAIPPIVIIRVKPLTARWTAVSIAVLTIVVGWSGFVHYGAVWFAPAWSGSPNDAQAQLDAERYLTEHGHSGIVYAPGWAHMAAIEYLSSEPGRFFFPTADSKAPGMLVINRRLPLPDTLEFARLSSRCRPLRTFGSDYEIHACSGTGEWNSEIIPLLEKEGKAAASIKSREATKTPQTGWREAQAR